MAGGSAGRILPSRPDVARLAPRLSVDLTRSRLLPIGLIIAVLLFGVQTEDPDGAEHTILVTGGVLRIANS
ncbi:hypothetical protein [Nocardia sp. CA-120079]|uniref:hypothetical protein n=1 Tax=Nocardia sp. CA-120079 TaxID=3239974 RepID=UPI003D973589